jgi:hypothetical protein
MPVASVSKMMALLMDNNVCVVLLKETFASAKLGGNSLLARHFA